MRPGTLRTVTPVVLAYALAASEPAFSQARAPATSSTQSPSQRSGRQSGQISKSEGQKFFVSGKVRLLDGSAPPKPVAIERVCSGLTIREGVTDRKGGFLIDLAKNTAFVFDAAAADQNGGLALTNPGLSPGTAEGSPDQASQNGMIADLQSCELRVVLAGFHSEAIDMAGLGRDPMPVKDVGTIILRPLVPYIEEMLHRNAERERAISAKAATEDNGRSESEKALAKARRALAESQIPEAQRELEHLVEIDPNNAAGWYELGRVRDWQKNGTEAKRCYQRAIAVDQKYEGAYLLLANLLGQEQQWQELADVASKLIQLNPTSYPAAYFYRSAASYNLGYLDEAGKAAREGLQIDPDHRMPRLHYMLGTVLADDRQFADAAGQMKLYLKFAPTAQDRDEAHKMVGEWEKLASAPPPGDKPR
jgi:tetratricopeptide (TPR) repeat protein